MLNHFPICLAFREFLLHNNGRTKYNIKKICFYKFSFVFFSCKKCCRSFFFLLQERNTNKTYSNGKQK